MDKYHLVYTNFPLYFVPMGHTYPPYLKSSTFFPEFLFKLTYIPS